MHHIIIAIGTYVLYAVTQYVYMRILILFSIIY